MTITLNALQKQRRDTASNWTTNNTVLLAGELGYETDTKKFKIGDGTTAWQSLDYLPIPDTNRLLAGNLTVGGNFTVNGTTTTIDTTTLIVEDKNIEIGKVSTPTDSTADGGGITLKGATDKTINWVDSTDSWTLSEHLDIATGKVFKINNAEVLSATTLGSSVVSSSLTSVGTIATGTWNATAISGSKVTPDFGSQNILTTGSIAIGTSSINAKLTIEGTSQAIGSEGTLKLQANANGADIGAGITFGNNTARRAAIAGRQSGTDATAGYLQFGTRGSTGDITEKMRINSSGNVGIGTTSPNNKLDVNGGIVCSPNTDGKDTFELSTHAVDEGRLSIKNVDTTTIQLRAGGISYLNGGNVGIGTTSPTEKLDVAGSIRCNTGTDISMDSSASGQVRFRGNGYTGAIALNDDAMHIYSNASSRDLVFGVNASEKMRIDSTGSVVIGATSSNSSDIFTLHDAGNAFMSIRSDTEADNTFQILDFAYGTSNRSSSNLAASIQAKTVDQASGTLKAELQFYTNAGDSITNRMIIKDTGNVGIGTSIPAAKFHVSDTYHFTVAGGNSTTGMQIGNYVSSTDTYGVLTYRASTHRFDISGNNKMTINSAGDLNVQGVYDSTTSSGANVNVHSDGHMRRSTSSRRYKNTILDATHGLTELLKLKSVTFKGNEDGDTIFGGLIAEDVHDAGLTEFVQYDKDKQPDALAYGNMVALCVKAIQELTARVAALEAA